MYKYIILEKLYMYGPSTLGDLIPSWIFWTSNLDYYLSQELHVTFKSN
jgi:hypothetical protein